MQAAADTQICCVVFGESVHCLEGGPPLEPQTWRQGRERNHSQCTREKQREMWAWLPVNLLYDSYGLPGPQCSACCWDLQPFTPSAHTRSHKHAYWFSMAGAWRSTFPQTNLQTSGPAAYSIPMSAEKTARAQKPHLQAKNNLFVCCSAPWLTLHKYIVLCFCTVFILCICAWKCTYVWRCLHACSYSIDLGTRGGGETLPKPNVTGI